MKLNSVIDFTDYTLAHVLSYSTTSPPEHVATEFYKNGRSISTATIPPDRMVHVEEDKHQLAFATMTGFNSVVRVARHMS